MGLVAAGVNGIKLRDGDEVVGAGVASRKGEVLVVSNFGNGKRIDPDEFPVQGRYGLGVIAWKLPEDECVAGMMIGLKTHNGVVHFKDAASRLVHVSDASSGKRTQKGSSVIDVKQGDQIIEMTVPLDMV